ncbi:MAG: type II secretion system F family protein [Armatimonadetes bacterium]|nr:type II secretion system F family protein [Armatimonadota bacterium]MDW8120923.1 type II secretion system F family protein [Armatimonadota bacterium]
MMISFPIALALVIGLWVVALGFAGYQAYREIRERQVRATIARLTRVRQILTEEEEQVLIEDEELKPSLPQRVAQMILTPALHLVSRWLPVTGIRGGAVEGLLAMAGYPLGLTERDVIALRFLFLIVGAVLGIVIPTVGSIWVRELGDPTNVLLFAGILSIFGFLGPTFWLRRVAMNRRRLIMRQMPDMLDLITLSVEAGLGFDAAVFEATRRFRGPLSDELKRVMRDVSLGKRRADALSEMAERVKLEDISLLVSAVHQAEALGSPLGDALKALAAELRKKRIRMIREQIAKLPVKLIFPLVLFIFPTLFIVLLGPAVIQVQRTGFGG